MDCNGIISLEDLHKDLQQFWQLEEPATTNKPNDEEFECESIFQTGVVF